VNGLVVIPRGAAATALVTEAEPRNAWGTAESWGSISTRCALRTRKKRRSAPTRKANGSNSSAGAILPLASGKDVVFMEGTDFTAYVDGDMKLKKAAFQTEKDSSSAAPAHADHKPSQPRWFSETPGNQRTNPRSCPP